MTWNPKPACLHATEDSRDETWRKEWSQWMRQLESHIAEIERCVAEIEETSSPRPRLALFIADDAAEFACSGS